MKPRNSGLLLGLSLGVSLWSSAASADAIVIDGVEIADAALVAAAAAEGNRMIMYHGWPEQMFANIEAAFTADTGITLETVRLTSQRMHPRVSSEYAAGQLEADYVDLTDLVLLADLVDQGIVNYPHRVPWFDDLAPGYRDEQGRWYAGGLFVQIMAVNTALVPESDYPESWLDALEPRWLGEIGMPSIDAGGSAFALHTFLRQQIAPDYWERLKEQQPRIYPAVAPAGTDLVRGEFSLGLMGASTVVANIAQGAPLRVIFPREGIAAFPISGGITTTAQRPASAAIWLNWITSARAASVLAEAGVYGVHPSGPVPVLADGRDYPPVSQVWTIDPDNWTQVRESYSVEWRAIFE